MPFLVIVSSTPAFVPLSVGQDVVLEMLPNPFSPRSTLSRHTLDDLINRRLVEPEGPSFLLRDLRIIGQRVPDVTVGVGAAAGFLRIDGILGFDLFERFQRVVFEPATRQLTLVRR